jgi:beta-mannosidase
MYKKIDLSNDWRIFHCDLDHGLLGNAGRAYQREYVPDDAVTADVPVTATTAWLEDGRIPDPYVGMNSRDILWMEQKEWWYLKDFDLERLDGCHRLTFEGINYRAEAWLNDVQIGTWEGSFLKKTIDLDPALLRSKGNRLAVRVRTQERAWEDGTQPDPRGFQNSSAHIRTQGPTPQYAYGWNWSPHLIAVGIWRPVVLEWMGTARFGDTRIHSELSEDLGTGSVRFTGLVEGLGGPADGLAVELTARHPDGSTSETRQAIEGLETDGSAAIDLTLTFPKPDLWFPNGFGRQPLYQIEARLVSANDETCDERTRRVGFRRIEFIPNTNDLEVQATSGQTNRLWSIVGKPYPWTMVVNGLRIFSKGTNWCPVDNLYRDRNAHVRRLLELAREAHTVFIRIWGGGLTESDYFYDCCDELGLLCLQEFWFACGSAPAMNHRVFLENAESELIRLRERTSIALWGGGNEFNPDNHENRPVIDLIDDLVARMDGSREFRRGSPYRGDRHGGLVSTPHYTTNKYRDLLPGRRRLVLLRSECAVGRSPTRPTNIRKFVPEESLWPVDWKVYQNHHAQRPEWEEVSRPFGEATTWEQALLHASVFHCIDSRLNMEYARASKYESSGCWTWQINASWPSFHREHIDWYGDPKPVYYWYKNACKPVIALADFERFVWHPGELLNPELFAVNDTHEPVPVEVAVQVYTLDGTRQHESLHRVEIPADAPMNLGRLDWRIPVELAEQVLYLALETTANGKVVHRNTYYVAVSPDTVFQSGHAIGERLKLSYLGKTSEVSAPHYYTLADIVDEPTEHDKEQKHAADDELDAIYSTTFDLPAHLSGRSLEIHLPGVSGDDTVILNDEVIGEGLLDLENEFNYEADPVRWPNLPSRHYSIPAELIREQGNEVQIRLSGRRLAPHTDKRFGLTRMITLREATPVALQTRIADYNRAKAFFRPITEGPQGTVELTVAPGSDSATHEVRLSNPGSTSVAFVVLDLVNEGEARFFFDEGALSALHPGETVTVTLRVEGHLPADAAVEVRSLNCPTTRCAVASS